jgi:hypothetical protein
MNGEFIRQEEAAKAITKAEDLATNQLVTRATVQALVFTPLEKNERPIADFDMKYFVEVMLNLFRPENHKTIQAILNGEDLRWFDDEDFK